MDEKRNGPANDESIGDEEILYRRIHPEFMEGGTPSTQAFQNYPGRDAMSVYLHSELAASNCSPMRVLDGHPGYRLAALKTGDVRRLGQGVVRAVEEDDSKISFAHAHVVGQKKSKAVKRGLRDAARLLTFDS